MANYLIQGLSLEQREALLINNVGLIEFDNAGSYLIDKEQLKLALTVLDCRVDSKQPSGYEEIEMITLRQKGVWMISGIGDMFSGQQKANLEAIISEEVVEKLQCDVQVNSMGGQVVDLVSDNRFHIYLWSCRRSTTTTHTPSRIWGHKTGVETWAFIPTGDGYVIEDDGFALAEVIDDEHIYIHFDLLHKAGKAKLAIFRRILNECVAFVTSPNEAKLEYFARMKNSEREVSRRNYIAAVSERFASQAAGAREFVSSIGREVPGKIHRYAQSTRKNFLASEELSRERLEAEFEAITEIEKVREVRVSSGRVMVHTEMLTARDPATGALHHIGEFLIVVHLDGSHEVVQWYNRTQRVDGVRNAMNAPRVYSSGSACATDLKEIFPSLVACFEIAPVIQMAIEFIETASANNELDQKIDHWPTEPANYEEI